MTNEVIVVGDVVQLKSGGPAMTVSSVDKEYGKTTCECRWFDAKEHRWGQFRPEILEKVEGNKKKSLL